MSSTIKKQVEDVVIARIAARPYCTTNSIPVRRWGDASNAVNVPNTVAVGCTPPGDVELERGPLWDCPVEVQARTYRHDDNDRTILEGICGDIEEFGRNCPLASMTAASEDLTFDGFSVEPGVEVPDEKHHMVSYTFTAHVQET